jgi:hypothetical protein
MSRQGPSRIIFRLPPNSRWSQREWKLQESLAPQTVFSFDARLTFLGRKRGQWSNGSRSQGQKYGEDRPY